MGIILSVLGISYLFSKKYRLLSTLKKVKAVPIQRVQENVYSKIVGKAKFVKEPLIAPLSGRTCVFYQIVVEQKRGKNGWNKLVDQTITQDFFIESRGEMAVVKLKQAGANKIILLDKDRNMSSGTFKDANHRLETYLKNHGTKSTNFLGLNKTLRYKEGIIEPNEDIVVMGVAEWKTLKEPIAGYNYSKVLTLNGNKDQKLLVTDLDKPVEDSKNDFSK